jgi:hypothetical protein
LEPTGYPLVKRSGQLLDRFVGCHEGCQTLLDSLVEQKQERPQRKFSLLLAG